MNPEIPDVIVSLVTWNSASRLEACLESVRAQSVPVEVRIFDNHSSDLSVEIAEKFSIKPRIAPSNLGFSRAHNLNLRRGRFRFALILNPDVILDSRFVESLVEQALLRDRVGMAGGKLYRMNSAGDVEKREGQKILDSAGFYFTPALRHLDRGSEQPDDGRYDRPEEVFGTTGAAMMISDDFHRDASVDGEFFDEDFFAYREDADLAWRGRLLGWKCLYRPEAEALHRRAVLPERRRRLSPQINYHSVKNRFLMRIKNIDWAVRARCFPYMWLRDLAIAAYLPVRERSSLKAYSAVRHLRGGMLRKRADIQSRRKISPREMASWFAFRPRVAPFPD